MTKNLNERDRFQVYLIEESVKRDSTVIIASLVAFTPYVAHGTVTCKYLYKLKSLGRSILVYLLAASINL